VRKVHLFTVGSHGLYFFDPQTSFWRPIDSIARHRSALRRRQLQWRVPADTSGTAQTETLWAWLDHWTNPRLAADVQPHLGSLL